MKTCQKSYCVNWNELHTADTDQGAPSWHNEDFGNTFSFLNKFQFWTATWSIRWKNHLQQADQTWHVTHHDFRYHTSASIWYWFTNQPLKPINNPYWKGLICFQSPGLCCSFAKSVTNKEFKRGNWVSFWPLWGGDHIACHLWKWVIVPLDLARSAHIIITAWFTAQ